MIYYQGTGFDEEFLFFINPEGIKIKLSKGERALLKAMTRRRQMLFSRDTLLTIIQSDQTEVYDRNIDYYVSRLRRKLKDSAKNPKFIATQYGEGYFWLPNPDEQSSRVTPKLNIAFIKICPPLGVGLIHGLTPEIANNMQLQLKNAMAKHLSPNQTIVFGQSSNMPHESLKSEFVFAKYSLQVSFLNSMNETLLLASIYDCEHKKALKVEQVQIPKLTLHETDLAATATNLFENLVSESLEPDAQLYNQESEPLTTFLYKAAQALSPHKNSLAVTERFLRKRHYQKVDKALPALLLAMNLNNQLYSRPYNDKERREKENEISALILVNIEFYKNNPLHLSAASDLLFKNGYKDIAESYSKLAVSSGFNYAACLMVEGKIHACRGRFDLAIAYYDQCLAIYTKRDYFYSMLLSLKAIVLLASKRHTSLESVVKEIVLLENRRLVKIFLQAGFLHGDEHLGKIDRILLGAISSQRAKQFVSFNYYITARIFDNEQHRINIIEGPMTFFIKQYGPDIVPNYVKTDIPSYFSDHLTRNTIN